VGGEAVYCEAGLSVTLGITE